MMDDIYDQRDKAQRHLNPLVLVTMAGPDRITRILVEVPHPIASAEHVREVERIAQDRLLGLFPTAPLLQMIGFQRLEPRPEA